MTQQYIDFGSFPDDPSADSIRESFQKTQDNFTDLYTNSLKQGVMELVPGAGLRTVDDRITGNLILHSNISNITVKTTSSLVVKPEASASYSNSATVVDNTAFVIGLSPNLVTANANFTGTLQTANLKVTGLVKTNLVPEGDEVLDLGSPTHRWRDLYLSGQTLTIGTQTISSDSTGFQISAGLITSNLSVGTVQADYVGGLITTSNQPSITNVGILQGLSVDGDIASGNISVIGNLDSYAVNASTMNVSGVFNAGTITGNIVLPPGATLDAPGGTNANMAVMFNDSGKAAAVPGLSYNKTSNLLTIQGNVEGGNLITSGAMSVTKTASVGNLLTGGNVAANSGTISGGSVISLGILTASNTITGGNLSTGGYLTVTGDASIGNITTTNVNGVQVTVSGNVSGANLVASGILKVDGAANVGSLTTSGLVSAATLQASGSATITGTATAGNLATGGDLTVTGNASSNVNTANSHVGVTGTWTGNVQGANLRATGTLSVTSGATVGSLTTSGAVSANTLSTTGDATIAGHITTTSGNIITTNGKLAGAALYSSGLADITGDLLGRANITANGILSVLGHASLGNVTTGGMLNMAGGAKMANTLAIGSSLTITSASGNGTHATLTFATQTFPPFAIGSSVVVQGVTPIGYNTVSAGVVVTDCSNTTVTYASTGTGAMTVAGTVLSAGTGLNVVGNVSGGNLNITGILRAGDSNMANVNATGAMTVTGTHTAGNISTGGVLTVSGTATVGNISTGGNLTVSTNANVGNLGTTGMISADGNITGGNIKTGLATMFANGSIAGAGITVTGALSGANATITADLTSGNVYSNSGTIQSDLLKGNSVTITNNVTSGNMYANSGMINANVVGGNSATISGNVTGGNLKTGGATIYANGYISGANASLATVVGTLFQGNGASLTNLNSSVISTTIPTTATAGSGTVVTLTYTSPGFIPFYAGQSITVSGVTPTAYNGTFTVVSASATQVTYNHTATGAMTVAGSIIGGSRALSAQNADTAVTAGTSSTVTGSSQPNITSVGTLTSLTLSGGISGATSISSTTMNGGNITASGFFIRSVDPAITAVGTTQSTAYVLTKSFNVVTTATASSADSIRLPVAVAGLEILIVNASTGPINIFPASSCQIDKNGVNTPAVLGVDGKLVLYSTSTTQWYSLTTIYA